VYEFLKEASWKLLAELTYDELQQIYELTYKYGWIVAEERDQAHPDYPNLAVLPDRAYLEKLKIEDRLKPWIEYGLEEVTQTYEWWLSEHKEEGWIDGLLEVWEGMGIDNVLFNFYAWQMQYQPYLYEFVVEHLGGDRGILEAEDPESIIDGYGESFLEEQFWPTLTGEDLDKADETWTSAKEAYDEGHANKLIIDTYELYPNMLDWMISGAGWNGVEHLEGIYGVNDLLGTFANVFVENDTEFLKLMYKVYLNRFSGLDDQIVQIEKTFDEVAEKQSQGTSLEDQVLAFQYGLTTAHHNGTMADYLLNVGPGEGKVILDTISSGPEREKWDWELEKILGHPVGA